MSWLATGWTKLCGNKDANSFVLINAVVLTRKNICKIPLSALEVRLQLEISAIKHEILRVSSEHLLTVQ